MTVIIPPIFDANGGDGKRPVPELRRASDERQWFWVVLVLIALSLQYAVMFGMRETDRRERRKEAAKEESRRLTVENELRAIVMESSPREWPSSSAIAVRPADLVDSGSLYEGRRVLVIIRQWKHEDATITWRRQDSDASPTIQFFLREQRDSEGMKTLWIEGDCQSAVDGKKIVVTNCEVVHASR